VANADAKTPEGSFRVRDFMLSLPGIGETKVPHILNELGIKPQKRLGGLGIHQQQALRAFLFTRAKKRSEATARRLVVLAGPTAVGKGTVARQIRRDFPNVHLSISATTRAPRPGEQDGVDYYFVSDATFDDLITQDALLEWATVHGIHRYGTPRRPIEEALSAGKGVLLEIDLQGARQVKASMPEARLVFLLPPSWDELVRRLEGRGTESSDEQNRRLETARTELAAQTEFDVRVMNRDVTAAVAQVVDLLGISQE